MYIAAHKRHSMGPIWLEEVPDLAGHWMLRWRYAGNFLQPTHKVFMNGVEMGETADAEWPIRSVETATREMAIFGVKSGVAYHFEALALSGVQASGDFSGYFYAPRHGARLRLTVPAADLEENPDFWSYLIYWSEDGSDPTELLAELVGANNRRFTTAELADGTSYKFRYKLKDAVGNTSEYSATTTGTVNTLPEAVEDAAVEYDEETRTAAITASEPAAQDADVRGYWLWSNDLPGRGLQTEGVCQRVAWFAVGETIAFTTAELGAGLHLWEIRATDGSGLESAATTLALNLARSGGELVEIAEPPARPYFVDAVPIAGGKALITMRVLDLTDLTGINVYLDGVLDGTVTIQSGVYEYTYETAALTDGQTYEVTAKAAAGAVLSEASEAASVTADGSAPTVGAAITVEMVD
jgi:hypothetical protein